MMPWTRMMTHLKNFTSRKSPLTTFPTVPYSHLCSFNLLWVQAYSDDVWKVDQACYQCVSAARVAVVFTFISAHLKHTNQ